MTSPRYQNVTRPIKIGPVEIKNRFYFSPHGNPYFFGSAPSDAFAHYYGARAAGGCGLLIQAMNVIPGRVMYSVTPSVDSTLPSFKAVAEIVHSHGAKIFGQLHYSRVGASIWRYDVGSSVAPNFAPSPVQLSDDFFVTYELPVSGIKRMVDAYRRSARNLAAAGYDGVEIHCSHGMLCEAFLSPYFNRRTDEYGGCLENRMRFLVECLTAAREGGGRHIAVGMRFNIDEKVPGGLTQEDTKEILGRLVELELLDFVDMDFSIEPDQHPLGMPSYLMPLRIYEDAVRNVRTAAGTVPVFSVLGRMTSIADADNALATGVVDLVGATRGLMAEPNLVKNALEGREEDSRTCLACNLCMGGRSRSTWGCAINPATGREGRWAEFTPAPKKSKVVVVGAGPGGLEAARVAALRGHDVTVLEKRANVGGQLNLWASLPARDVFATTPRWYETQLHKLGVRVQTGFDADARGILAQKPDAVIVATGAHYRRDGETGFLAQPIPGWDQDFVYAVEDILEGGRRFMGKVLILDEEGLNAAAGVAEILASGGAEVELLTRRNEPLWNLSGTFEDAMVFPRLRKVGVALTTMTYIKEIGKHAVTLYDVYSLEERVVTDVSAVVMSAARTPTTRLAYELEGKVAQVFSVGDALAPRGLTEAIQEGHRFGRMIGEDGAPTDFMDAYLRPWDPASTPKAAAVLSSSA